MIFRDALEFSEVGKMLESTFIENLKRSYHPYWVKAKDSKELGTKENLH